MLPRKNPIEHGLGIVLASFQCLVGQVRYRFRVFRFLAESSNLRNQLMMSFVREREREYNENTERNSSFVNNNALFSFLLMFSPQPFYYLHVRTVFLQLGLGRVFEGPILTNLKWPTLYLDCF